MVALRTWLAALFLVGASAACPARAQSFVRGDSDADGRVTIADAVSSVLGCRFLGAGCSDCADAADANDDGRHDIADAIVVLQWLFLGGPSPPAPSPGSPDYPRADCGFDPTPDILRCRAFPPCAAEDPETVGFSIGVDGTLPDRPADALVFGSTICYVDPWSVGPNTVFLYGRNLLAADTVLLRDAAGNSAAISGARLGRARAPGGMERLTFTLTGVRLALRRPRTDLLVRVAAGGERSNEIAVPVQEYLASATGESLGPVLNAVALEGYSGDGLLHLRYSLYERPSGTPYRLAVSWSPVGLQAPEDCECVTENAACWFPAKLRGEAPGKGGETRITAGAHVAGEVVAGVPTGGARGALAWEVGGDPGLRCLVRHEGGAVVSVRLRLLVLPLDGDSALTRFETPPVAIAGAPAAGGAR